MRSKFQVSLWLIGTPALPLAEAYRLVQMLMRDPSSWLHAAVAGWDRPVSAEWMILADSHDLLHAANAKRRPKPYPRPWPENKTKIGGKKTVKRSISDVLSILRPGRSAE